ncbi:MAG: hypothetical protein ACLQC7_07040 [Thermoplasmata archaeon]
MEVTIHINRESRMNTTKKAIAELSSALPRFVTGRAIAKTNTPATHAPMKE